MSGYTNGDRLKNGFGLESQQDRARGAAKEFSKLGRRLEDTYIFCRGASSSTASTPILVFLHGAGHASPAWANFVMELPMEHGHVLAIELPGHGRLCDVQDKLALKDLLAHVKYSVSLVFERWKECYGEDCVRPHESAPLVLIGHSLGSALVAHLAKECAEQEKAKVKSSLPWKLSGLVLLDMQEETALAHAAAGSGSNIPNVFSDLTAAVEWSYGSTGPMATAPGAWVAVPSMLRLVVDEPAPETYDEPDAVDPMTIGGEDCDDICEAVTWRAPISATAPYWDEWFRGATAAFLGVRYPKMFVSAVCDQLDTQLTIAHMQGKFQHAVAPTAGHVIQADHPQWLVGQISTFLNRVTRPSAMAQGWRP